MSDTRTPGTTLMLGHELRSGDEIARTSGDDLPILSVRRCREVGEVTYRVSYLSPTGSTRTLVLYEGDTVKVRNPRS